MRQILCILTSSQDPLAEAVIAAEQTQPDCAVKVFELGEKPDYEELLDAILAADSVQVW
jgi:hypothetical protein